MGGYRGAHTEVAAVMRVVAVTVAVLCVSGVVGCVPSG